MSDSDSSSASSRSGSSSSSRSSATSASSKSSKSSVASKSSKASKRSSSSSKSASSQSSMELGKLKSKVVESSSSSDEAEFKRPKATEQSSSSSESSSEDEVLARKKTIEESSAESDASEIKSGPVQVNIQVSNVNLQSAKDVNSASDSDSSLSGSSSTSSRSSASSKNSAVLGRTKKAYNEESSDSELHEAEFKRGKSRPNEESGSESASGSISGSESDSSRTTTGSSRSSRTSGSSQSKTSASSNSSATGSSASSKSSLSNSSNSSSQSGSGLSSSDSSSDSDSDSSLSSRTTSSSSASSNSSANKDTLKKEKKADLEDVNLVVQVPEKVPDDPAVLSNPWVKLGKWADEVFFTRWFLPVFGGVSILLLVIFSILIDVRISGVNSIPYGVSFIPLLIGFLMWTTILVIAGLSRYRYAANIQKMPENDFMFERKLRNREGARIGVFFSSALALIMASIFLILVSINVDSSHPFNSWRDPFICIWIMLGFIAIAITFSWRLMHGYLNMLTHALITGGMTAVCICIYLKIQGHLPAGASWYKVLVPLWLLDLFLLVVLLWHVYIRTMCNHLTHPTHILVKSKKSKKPVDSFQDRAASLPLGVAGIFAFLFQVTVVAKTEGVFSGKYSIFWSFIWIWYWLACFFGFIWMLTYRYKPVPTDHKFTKV